MRGHDYEPRQQGQASKFVDGQLLASLSTPSKRGYVMRGSLFGLLKVEEYRGSSMRRVRNLYKQNYGKNSQQFLEDNPIIACPIPLEKDGTDPTVIMTNKPSRTAIIAGHHRVRLAPGHIVDFPTEFVAPSQAAEMYRMDTDRFINTAEDWMDETVLSFQEASTKVRKPHLSIVEERNGLYIAMPAPNENVVFQNRRVK